jgi:hypothetical protein
VDYREIWARNLLEENQLSIEAPMSIIGERNVHLGPRWEFAKVELNITPANGFQVVDAIPSDPKLRVYGHPDWVVFGLLDVLMTAESAPLTGFVVKIEKIEYHPIDSSPMALRRAGRNAATKLLEEVRARRRST